jgi:hypothetical protein
MGAKKKKKYLVELGVLCPFDVAQGGESIEPRLGGRNIRIRHGSCVAKFAQAAKTLNHSSTKFKVKMIPTFVSFVPSW